MPSKNAPLLEPPALPENLGTVAEAVAAVGLCDKTIRTYISEGRLTGYRVGAKKLLVDLDEVRALVRPIPPAAGSSVTPEERERIRAIVAEWPPLTTDQITKLRALFSTTATAGGAV